MTKGRRLAVLATFVAVVGVGGWWWSSGGAEAPVSEDQARRYLGRIVKAAQSRDFDALCDLNGSVGNCRRMLDTACDPSTAPPVISCRETVPEDPPMVVATRESPGKGYAGRVIVVRGVDRSGNPYQTEVLVFRENRQKLKATNSVYWSGARIIDDEPSTPE